jgi:ribosomal protein S18 acetylase RimI-like enzyme
VTKAGAPDEFALRVATTADARGVAEVHTTSWRGAYHGLLPQTLLDGLSVVRRAARWEQSISDGSSHVVVAVDRIGTIAGFVAVGNSRDGALEEGVGELYAIYLDPARWDRGVGRALLGAGTSALAARFDQATLWVLDANARARAFYERHGWRADGAVRRAPLGEIEVAEVRYRRQLEARGEADDG